MKNSELLSKHDSLRACEGFEISKKGEKMVNIIRTTQLLYMYKSVAFCVCISADLGHLTCHVAQ